MVGAVAKGGCSLTLQADDAASWGVWGGAHLTHQKGDAGQWWGGDEKGRLTPFLPQVMDAGPEWTLVVYQGQTQGSQTPQGEIPKLDFNQYCQ